MNQSMAGAPFRDATDGPDSRYPIERIRADFPILERRIHNRPLVYLDNGASAQKPRAVIEAMTGLMTGHYSNVHRGVHTLSQESTEAYEAVRDRIARFLNAPSREHIVITRNTTEAINLVAQSWGRRFLGPGDEILVSEMEHHANIVPWQLIGATLKVAPVDDDGVLDLDRFAGLLSPRTRLVAITHASNVLGTITPARRIADLAHDRGIPVLFDGSQAAVHGPVDVQAIDADFYVITGHKLYGPTGIGALYAKPEILESMPPWQGGGDMIASVSFAGTRYREPPYRFEAGTPPIVEGVGLKAALDYLDSIGMDAIQAHEQDLLSYATARLSQIPGLRLFGRAPAKAAIISFTLDGVHPHDLGTLLDRDGVAVRVGRHCAEPLMDRLGQTATARASFGLYNTRAEADRLVEAVEKAREFFA